MCLKIQPDAVTWIDHTTIPPTFHCRLRGSIEGRQCLGQGSWTGRATSHLRSWSGMILMVSQVMLQYQKTNEDNGSSYTLFDN